MELPDFELLTNPASVAVVGASNAPGSYGWRVFKILQDYGRDLRTYAVNPRHAGTSIQGVTALSSLRDLPEAPDCTLVVTPPPTVPGVLADMATVGGRAGVVLSAPHGSGLDSSRKFDEEVAGLADQHNLRLIGPNSMGLISPATGFAGTFGSGMLTNTGDEDPAPPGGIAMLSQSGAAISYLLEEHRGRGIGYSHLISTGNEAVVGFTDLLECLVQDPATHTIVLFIEAIKDGRRLRRAIETARRTGKAVVMMRIGTTDAGRAAAQSHSGRLAGTTGPYTALADDLDVIQVHSYQHLFDTFRILHAFPPTDERVGWSGGRRAAIITTSGGAAVAAIDELQQYGWTVPALSEDLRRRLDQALGEQGHDNPLDLLGLWRDDWRMAETLRILGGSGELDAVIAALGGGGPLASEVCRLAAEAATSDEVPIPVVFASLGLRRDAQHTLERSGAAIVPDLTRAVTGLEDRLRSAGVPPARVAAGGHERTHATGADDGGRDSEGDVPSGEVMRRLHERGVRCAPFRTVALAEDASALQEAAMDLGYPVALKIEHPGLLHKSDVGGVVVDVRTADEVADAHRRLLAVISGAGLGDAQVVVQRMVRGVEVIVGAQFDESFGHLLVVGLGGTLAELVDDVRLALLPVSKERIGRLVLGHERLAVLLAGHRGERTVDTESLIAEICKIAAWIGEEGSRLLEFDVNPLTATPDGAFVVDARAVYARDEVPL